jgi:hypothetical protein
MAKSDIDVAVAAENTQGRKSEGAGISFTSPSAKPANGTLVAKKNVAAGDPTAAGTKQNRANRPYSGQERLGAAYGVKASYAPQKDPSAGATQANGRIVNPSVIRQKDSWSEGMETSY